MKKKITLITLLGIVLFCFSCETEQLDTKIDSSSIIQKDSEIFEGLLNLSKYSSNSDVNLCIQLIYPFTIIEVNSSLEMANIHQVLSSQELVSVLENLSEGNSISISYPLVAVLQNGDTFTITNNDELLIALDNCPLDDIILAYGALFSNDEESKCIWKVNYSSGIFDNKFAGAVFEANEDGTIQLYYENNTYQGTWVFLFIDYDLYMNIFFTGNSSVTQYWNNNFKAFVSPYSIELKSGIDVNLIKSCLTQNTYVLGQDGPNGGIITHIKSDYSNGWLYLETANQDQQQEEWGCNNASVVSAQNSEIGGGLMNSIAIAKYHDGINFTNNPSGCSSESNGTLAAKTSLLLDNSLKNWHLPAIDELELMYNVMHLNGVGNFSNDIYWSSTEASINTVYGINFSNGSIVEIPKNSSTAKTRSCIYF